MTGNSVSGTLIESCQTHLEMSAFLPFRNVRLG